MCLAKARRILGIMLAATAIVTTIWLAVTHQLVLYIHPRYIVFTVIMAAVGLVFVIASFAVPAPRDESDEPKPRRLVRALSLVGIVTTLVIAIGMSVIPPATLTSATVSQRDINAMSVGANAKTVDAASAAPVGAFAKFSVLDWASLLRQTSDVSFYTGKPAEVIGFVTADPDDPQNVFYVSRFVITCCAVDAQPIGVPVYLEHWANTYTVDEWVDVTGQFAANPSRLSTLAVALNPASVTKIAQPSDPYIY